MGLACDLGPISKMKLVGILTLIHYHDVFHQQFKKCEIEQYIVLFVNGTVKY